MGSWKGATGTFSSSKWTERMYAFRSNSSSLVRKRETLSSRGAWLPSSQSLHPLAVGGAVAEIFSGTAQQRGGHFPLGGAVHLPGNIGRHGGGELLRLRRLTLAPAEAEDGRTGS